MPQSTIRVELHRATPQHYTRLQAQLRSRNILDRFGGAAGRITVFPTGEYFSEAYVSSEPLMAAVKATVNSLGLTASIVVNCNGRILHDGLKTELTMAAFR